MLSRIIWMAFMAWGSRWFASFAGSTSSTRPPSMSTCVLKRKNTSEIRWRHEYLTWWIYKKKKGEKTTTPQTNKWLWNSSTVPRCEINNWFFFFISVYLMVSVHRTEIPQVLGSAFLVLTSKFWYTHTHTKRLFIDHIIILCFIYVQEIVFCSETLCFCILFIHSFHDCWIVVEFCMVEI